MKHLLTIILLFCSVTLIAQNEGRISGQIKNQSSRKAVEATIVLFKDSVALKSLSTDSTGIFQFDKISDGVYKIKITSAGFESFLSAPITINQQQKEFNLNELFLKPKQDLKEVVVTAKKNFIERKMDKTILNVDGSISNTGTTVLEMLEKAPGISVDKDGNISMQGKKGVIVLVDGKQTYLTGEELTNFLRNLPSSNFDQVEIMTNPSSRYDASGNSGIINLKSKKIKQKGFNGSLSASYSQAFYPKTNNSLNLNYRINKINIFSTLSANYRDNFQDLNIYRRYKNEDGSTKAIFDQQSTGKKRRNNYNARLGMDYYASKKTTLGILLTGYTTPGNEVGSNNNFLKNGSGVLDSIVTADRKEKYTWRNGNVNLNFRHQFDSTGKEITADIDYLNYRSVKNQTFINSSFDANNNLLASDQLKGELPSDINVYSAKIDYSQKIFSKIKMEAGLKFSSVSTNNTASYFNVINDAKYIDYEKTNHFTYKENINAAYVSFNREIKKWSFQAGLRIENTNYKGKQDGNPTRTDSSFSRSYTGAFPTMYINFNADKKNQFGFSAGRRINRPDYEDLNPFLFFLDKYTYGSGNPFLRPMYSNVFELSHTYNQKFTTSLNYSHTVDLFNDVFREEGYKTIQSQGNYGKFDHLTLSVSSQLSLYKWWKANVYAEGSMQKYSADIYGLKVSNNNYNMLTNISNQFSFKNGWSAELSGIYRSRNSEGQIAIRAMGQLNAGVQKMILKDKGSLKLSFRDILKTMNPNGEVQFRLTEASFTQRRDNRTVTLSFNYRFGKPIKGLQKRKTGGAGDEQGRIKSGN